MSTREILDTGSLANDGTGDDLRSGANKINSNFLRVWLWAGGDSNSLSPRISFDSDDIVFEGNLIDSFETRLSAVNPTKDNSIILPDSSGTVILTTTNDTLLNKTLNSPILDKPKINDSDGTYVYNIIPAGGLSADRNITIPILSANDVLTFNAATQTLTNKTLISPNITTPDISGSINDVNGAEMIDFVATGSAVLNWEMTNAATGGSPILAAIGSDSDIDAFINAKNRGAVRISKGAYQMSTMTSAGTASRSRSMININSGSPIAITLADGSINGEFKIFTNAGAGTATITPTNFAAGTSFALAQNESCEVIWNGSNWFINGNQSVVTIV